MVNSQLMKFLFEAVDLVSPKTKEIIKSLQVMGKSVSNLNTMFTQLSQSQLNGISKTKAFFNRASSSSSLLDLSNKNALKSMFALENKIDILRKKNDALVNSFKKNKTVSPKDNLTSSNKSLQQSNRNALKGMFALENKIDILRKKNDALVNSFKKNKTISPMDNSTGSNKSLQQSNSNSISQMMKSETSMDRLRAANDKLTANFRKNASKRSKAQYNSSKLLQQSNRNSIKSMFGVKKAIKATRGEMLGLNMSLLFGGMALKQFSSNALKGLLKTYMAVTEGNTFMGKQITKLQAGWEFLKFSIVEALDPMIVMGFVDAVVGAFNSLSRFFADNPEWATGLVTTFGVLFAVGTAGMLMGQVLLFVLAYKAVFLAKGPLVSSISAMEVPATTAFAKIMKGLSGLAAITLIIDSIKAFSEGDFTKALGEAFIGIGYFTKGAVGSAFGTIGLAILITDILFSDNDILSSDGLLKALGVLLGLKLIPLGLQGYAIPVVLTVGGIKLAMSENFHNAVDSFFDLFKSNKELREESEKNVEASDKFMRSIDQTKIKTSSYDTFLNDTFIPTQKKISAKFLNEQLSANLLKFELDDLNGLNTYSNHTHTTKYVTEYE